LILIDANVPMFITGGDHPLKIDAGRTLQRLISERQQLVTDAEVFQEILHRFSAVARPAAIQPTFDALRVVVDEVFPIEEEDVFQAKDLLSTHPRLSARDALHASVMRRRGIERIFTFDHGFDSLAGIQRIPA